MDILNLLSRKDKYYLGGGNRMVWTPEFPVWLDRPGFWDKANFYNYDIDPVFTVTLLNESGQEIPLHLSGRDWNPATLTQTYTTEFGLSVVEEKAVMPEDSLVSVFVIKNETQQPLTLHYVAWSIQRSYPSEGKEFVDNLDLLNDKIIFTKFMQMKNLPLYSIHCAFGISGVLTSYQVNFSQSSAVHPYWSYTPFYDQFSGDLFNNEIKIEGIDQDGLIYMALHKKLSIPPNSTHRIWASMSFAGNDDEATDQLTLTLNHHDPVSVSSENWMSYFDDVPNFFCSDPWLTRYYWYRWYGLRLLSIQGGGEPNYPYSSGCEGPSYFRFPVSYSAQCHLLETRWMHSPEIAWGTLLNFINLQNRDGSFPGHIYPNGVKENGFYHANWGRAILAVDQIHPNRNSLEQAYHSLTQYAAYFDRERDGENTGLYDVFNQFETGQEYMRRYLAVDDKADTYDWGRRIHLKGIDATVYLYELKLALAKIARKLNRKDESRDWLTDAEKIKQAVLDFMWEPEQEMFFDVDPDNMTRTNVKAAVCFYPYMTNIVNETHLPGLKRHLLNPDEFWTPWPIPATSADDPLFSPDAEWKGKRHQCPWNGRVWPMTNSHIADVLAHCAIRFQDRELHDAAVTFVNQFIRMMHHENQDGKKDFNRPNCFEHYHPFNGRASLYRGIDDYQHSWVVDWIIKYVAGVSIDEKGDVTVNPLDFGLKQLELKNIVVAGKSYSIQLKDGQFNLIELE